MVSNPTTAAMNTSAPSVSAPPVHALDLSIGGMTCASCVGRVERALRKVPGVQEATVNLATESARIQFAPPDGGDDAAMDALLRRAVRNAGYEPLTAAASQREEDTSPWTGFAPVAIGLLLSAPLVLPMVGDLFGAHWMLPAWCSLCWPRRFSSFWGRAFLQGGLGGGQGAVGQHGFARRHWHQRGLGFVDVAVADSHCLACAAPVLLRPLPWWSRLVLLGKWLEARAKHQTTAAIRALHGLRPGCGAPGAKAAKSMPVAEVMVGDRLVVRPGERLRSMARCSKATRRWTSRC